MSDGIVQKTKVAAEEGLQELGKGFKEEASAWGKETWDAIYGPTDPQEVAQAQQRAQEIEAKRQQELVIIKGNLDRIVQAEAEQRRKSAQQKQVQQVQQQQETVQKNSAPAVAAAQAQKQRQLNPAEYSERAAEIKGRSVGG